MLVLLLLALLLAHHAAWRRAIAILTAAALVKFIPLVLLSLYTLLWLRQQPHWPACVIRGIQAAVLALAVAVAVYAPYGLSPRSLATAITVPLMRQSQTRNSLYSLLANGGPVLIDRFALGYASDQVDAVKVVFKAMVKWSSKAIFFLAWLLALGALWREPTFERFVQRSFWLLLVLLLFAAPFFWPWYATWLLPLAALMRWRPAGQVTVAFTATVLLHYVAAPESEPIPLLLGLRALYIFVPVMALLAYLLYTEWRQRPVHEVQREAEA